MGHYTRRQLQLFYRKALLRENQQRIDRIEDNRLAFWGKSKK